MNTFFVVYMAPVSSIDKMMSSMKPEDMKKSMGEWKTWMTAHQNAIVDMGAPLGKNMRVTSEGISDARNEITGFTIVQADSHQEAAKLFEGHPHLQFDGGYIEVLKMTAMPGM